MHDKVLTINEDATLLKLADEETVYAMAANESVRPASPRDGDSGASGRPNWTIGWTRNPVVRSLKRRKGVPPRKASAAAAANRRRTMQMRAKAVSGDNRFGESP